ncbi:hypothetical protein, partial [Nocardia abscessus]|uniref:hypothetical protein n=1 Tax=Nocardia abscessus TaxID=120957 RepID=UPI0024576685
STIQRLTGAAIKNVIGKDIAGLESMEDTKEGVQVIAAKHPGPPHPNGMAKTRGPGRHDSGARTGHT